MGSCCSEDTNPLRHENHLLPGMKRYQPPRDSCTTPNLVVHQTKTQYQRQLPSNDTYMAEYLDERGQKHFVRLPLIINQQQQQQLVTKKVDSYNLFLPPWHNEEIMRHDLNEECAICLETFEKGQTVARLECLCVYHKSCIEVWAMQKRVCPQHTECETLSANLLQIMVDEKDNDTHSQQISVKSEKKSFKSTKIKKR
ncbi:unnamed protein product [Didymodactylos carnosus]|uniref:RING-type E3 ubiquitin transferase n=1 Tax=Didymodactylos carnosus TaxID=1234261 RepID=A0A815AQN4_9BILA|nr:unnamed protein product [Didymodactylos carnosus]CAF1258915.1 unnamed protein product [Didymodactylos carnosus]CAF3572846.1 unnamed protein product [Didymodactylos carnosus]CAF4034743.1 unnamed protein product [Didymodactylos carnosus]